MRKILVLLLPSLIFINAAIIVRAETGINAVLNEPIKSKDAEETIFVQSYWELTKALKNKSIFVIKDSSEQKVSKTYSKAKEIINTIIDVEMTEYQKILAIHDYIVNNTRYDYSNFLNNTIPADSFRPYGVLINGTGVCGGYAETVELLATMAGIECIVISGDTDRGAHAWNIVKLNDKYYHIDATWDDPVSDNPERMHEIRYDYFLVNDEIMSLDHDWDTTSYPICKDLNSSYNSDVAIAENYKEFSEVLKNAIEHRKNDIKILVKNYNRDDFDMFTNTILFPVDVNEHIDAHCMVVYRDDKNFASFKITYRYEG